MDCAEKLRRDKKIIFGKKFIKMGAKAPIFNKFCNANH